MAEHQVALVPTMIQLDNFEMYAQSGEDRFPAYARHMRALYASRLERFGKALDAGVPIYAGTDAGGFFRTAWSVRRLRRWDSSARLSTRWARVPGGLALGSATRLGSVKERWPTWWSSTPIRASIWPC